MSKSAGPALVPLFWSFGPGPWQPWLPSGCAQPGQDAPFWWSLRPSCVLGTCVRNWSTWRCESGMRPAFRREGASRGPGFRVGPRFGAWSWAVPSLQLVLQGPALSGLWGCRLHMWHGIQSPGPIKPWLRSSKGPSCVLVALTNVKIMKLNSIK